MSSYRSSYQPWKTSLPSNYKSGSSSAYSSRDDVSTTPRYTSLASPSSYRPSFSGGTYRLKRDTPVTPASTYVSRYSNTTSSGVTKPDSELKRYGSTSSNLGKYSREPSPAALEHTNRIKSRDPSPVTRTLRGKSRDPSPALDTKCKIGYGASSTYRMNVPKSPVASSYNSRYGGSTASTRSSTTTSSSSLADKSISYLSASDFKARSITKAKETATRKSNEKELEATAKEEVTVDIKNKENETKEEHKTETTQDSETSEEEETYVSITVCNRATSPTPPGTNTIQHRTRRLDIAKTIEKTIQRSTKKKKMLEKEIQSDRLDDSTRYSRFGLSSRVSSYSPHSERYSASCSPRYSNSPLATTSKSSTTTSSSSNTESKKEDTTSSSSLSSKITKVAGTTKSKLSPPKSVKLNSRQSSVENLSAQKPPAAPKGESPSKTSSSSNGVANSKLPNKDFRKSALNVGPTDRPRKSRTPSTGTDSDLNTVDALNGALQAIQRLERSPSAGSEISNASSRSIRRTPTETKLRGKCHNKPLTTISRTNSPLRRNNSTTNLKTKSSTSSTTSSSSSPSTPSTTTTASSSSGTESSTEHKKSTKKIIKKKLIKDVTLSNSSTSANDLPSIKSSNENSFSLQQPPAALATNSTKSKKSDSSTNSRTTPKTPSSEKDPLRRLKKLSSVSNFFATQQKDQTNSDEQIYLESSENSSGNNDLEGQESQKSISLTQANETKTPLSPTPPAKTKNTNNTNRSSSKSPINYTENSIDETKNVISKSTKSTSSTKSKSKLKSKSSSSTSSSYCPQDTTTVNEESSRMPTELQTESLSSYTTTNPTTSSTSGTDQEESSWWQDTSRQIDTASALDFNLKDEMRFKIRHIDSGETAWWLRNDEDDTLADDDLKTLNQEEEGEEEEELGNEEDDEEATDQLKTLSSTQTNSAAKLSNGKAGWWISESDYDQQNDNETNYRKSRSSNDVAYQTNGYCVEETPVEAKPFPKSRITPETDWWNEEESANETNDIKNHIPSPKSQTPSMDSKSPKQNGSVQLKICRVESGEKPWWIQEQEDGQKTTDVTVEATISIPKKSTTENSSSNSDSKNRWLSGPTKKIFNIPRVESGEKAWWQQEELEQQETKINSKDNSSKIYKRNNSQEQEWWLEDKSKSVTPPQQQQSQNGYYPPLNAQYSNQTDNHDIDEEEMERYNPANYNQHMDTQTELSDSFNFEYSERPPPLGQCASPVQLEVPQRQQHCKSPYDNIPMTKVQNLQNQMPNLESATNFNGAPIYHAQQQQQQQHLEHLQQHQLYPPQQQQQYFPHQRHQQHQQSPAYNNNELRLKNGKLFISRHQNIDELLGGSCRPISPLFYDNINSGSYQAMSTPPPPHPRNMFLEEITPDQVRIHDSTAQMPIIQRMERDDWERDSPAVKTTTTPPRYEQRMVSAVIFYTL